MVRPQSLREDDVVERALRAKEPPEPVSALVVVFVVLPEATYDVRDGAVPEGPRLVTDNGPSTVAQPRSVGEARLVVHS